MKKMVRPSGDIAGSASLKPVPPEALRRAVHRLARIAGATRIEAPGVKPALLRKALVGKIEV